ncbi:MAG: hypothetical protein KDB01_16670 [Planctomycetaceae bacterium]|nr:hypothetical protein [Planctomycetaceae bacterium]
MNARVFLLILVTGAFMAVWDADRPTTTSSVAKMQSHQPSLTPTSDAVPVIPLPTGLQAGTWQVFNHDGDTFRITVEGRTTSVRRTPPSQVEDEQICVVTASDGIRWCFVKNPIATALDNVDSPR